SFVIYSLIGHAPAAFQSKVFMRNLIRFSLLAIPATAILLTPLPSAPTQTPLYQLFLSPASPQEVVAAKKVDRIAWVDYAEGKRNAFTAAAPLFVPVKL